MAALLSQTIQQAEAGPALGAPLWTAAVNVWVASLAVGQAEPEDDGPSLPSAAAWRAGLLRSLLAPGRATSLVYSSGLEAAHLLSFCPAAPLATLPATLPPAFEDPSNLPPFPGCVTVRSLLGPELHVPWPAARDLRDLISVVAARTGIDESLFYLANGWEVVQWDRPLLLSALPTPVLWQCSRLRGAGRRASVASSSSSRPLDPVPLAPDTLSDVSDDETLQVSPAPAFLPLFQHITARGGAA